GFVDLIGGCARRLAQDFFKYLLVGVGFFFSSRRRHTRSKRDWSSDVCSSDLNFVTVPLPLFLEIQGLHTTSLTINVKTSAGNFEPAQDRAQLILRARRHLGPKMENDFFIGTKDSYMALWKSISSAFFGVFILVSAISVLIGGIVIMNVMLVSVTLRKREIGVRRALGATQGDILKQFITESFMQCIAGGVIGIALGFLVALVLRPYTPFPAP